MTPHMTKHVDYTLYCFPFVTGILNIIAVFETSAGIVRGRGVAWKV